MSKPPMCKLCGKAHWFNEPHNLAGRVDRELAWMVKDGMPKHGTAGQSVSRETLQEAAEEVKRYDWDQRRRDLGIDNG